MVKLYVMGSYEEHAIVRADGTFACTVIMREATCRELFFALASKLAGKTEEEMLAEWINSDKEANATQS